MSNASPGLKITSGKTRLCFHNEVDTNLVDYISLLLEQLAYSSISLSTQIHECGKKSIFSFYKTYTACLRLKYYTLKIFQDNIYFINLKGL